MEPYSTAESWTGMPGVIAPADGNYAPSSAASVHPDAGRASLPAGYDDAGAAQNRRQDAGATNRDDFDDVLNPQTNGGPDAPIDLGPNNERLEDVNPKVVHALRELVRQYREEGVVARRNEIRRIRQARLFWQGLQYAWWNPNDMNRHLPYESRSGDDRQLEDMPRYQFVTNFYQGFGLSFVAVLSQDVPSVRFYPQSAQSLQDISAARAASDVATLIEQNNHVEELLSHVGYFLWTDGKLGAYVRYVADGQRFGFHDENMLEALEIPLGDDVHVCPQCGKETTVGKSKGPNPTFSLSRYGGYSSPTSTPPSTTGSISASSTTLTLASAQDFANGQGIVVYKAGPSPTVTTPGQPTVTPTNLLNGTTTWNYKAVAEDRNGALTAAGTAGATTTGAATIGANTVTLTSCVRTTGVATYTASAAHNLQAGAQVNIEGFSGGVFDSCNGVKTIAATPTGTTFTTNDGPLGNENNTTGTPTAVVFACNTLTFPSASFSGNNTIHYWIYRSQGAGAYSLVGVAQGVDPWFQDCGLAAPNAPAYVPATPPGTTQPGYLATTIASGGGTTTLTLANAASTAASGQTVLHDNSVPLKNATQAAYTAGGGTVYIPNSLQFWTFNSTLDFTSGLSISGSLVVRIHLNTGFVFLNQPWLLRGGMDLEGEPHNITSFSYVNGAQMLANTAYPMLILPEYASVTSVHLNRLMLTGNQPQQSVVLADSGSDGGGVSGLVFDDVNFNANGAGTPIIIKGGFDFFFNRGNCQGGAATFVPQSCLQFTNASPAVTGSTPAQVPGRVKVNGLYFAGNAIDIDCLPDGTNVAHVDFTFNTTIFESAVAPYLRFNCPTGIFNGIVMDDVVQADSVVGLGTPSIDAQNDASIGSVLWKGGAVNGPQQPAFVTSANLPSLLLMNAPFTNPGNTPNTNVSGAGVISTGLLAASGTGRVETFMAATTGPSVAVSSGGSVPIGTIPYRLQWVDVDGNYSPVSPIVNAVTTTGNQTVTLTPPTAPAGAVFWVAYRNDAEVNAPPGGCALGYIPINSTYVDTFSFTCGQQERAPLAGVSIIGPNGVSGPSLRLVNNGNTLTFLTSLTASRNVTLPDLSGVAMVSGYVNTAFDNATRANGAIGSNWTVTNANTINIASNNFVGTGANSVAYWSASTFNPVQFAQATITAFNGTTDFPGIVTLMSGTGGGAQGYECVEDTTTIFIQKISGTSNTTLTSGSTTGATGDTLRLEAVPGATSTVLTCYKNGVSTLTTTDSSSPYLTGSPGLFLFGTVASESNWSGGNLHPFAQLDSEESWVKPQHLDGNGMTCTMSAGTTCTATLSSAKWRGCIAQVQGTSAAAGAAACNISGTTLTVTAAGSNSSTWGILVF